ncbi:transcriptional activator RfaH [Paracoccaceae bacterium]|nr:transcriptional activator RfaH [Paracoccaceae bacterium]
MHQWYLIQFKPNSHRTAERNLNQQGFKTFLPLYEITSRNRSKFTSSIKPLFPGYMFVSIEHNGAPWRKINSTVGVSRIVCYDGKPKPLPIELVSGLISRCDRFGKLLPQKTLATGDSVELLSGAFTNFVATVEEIDSKQRIWLVMEIMGRRARVQVKSGQLKPSFN